MLFEVTKSHTGYTYGVILMPDRYEKQIGIAIPPQISVGKII